MKLSREYYEQLFSSYPSVVTLKVFRKMLGGINEKTALELMRQNIVKHFFIRKTYFIPKECIIDYILNDYQKVKNKFKSQI